MQNIHICEVDGKQAACFDTGLDPRSFARTKMSQSLIEPGYIVFPDGSNNVWKASGVNELDGFMRVWGPSFAGERLDLILNKTSSFGHGQAQARQEAVKAIAFWIRAKLLISETPSAISPGAAFVCCTDGGVENPKGSVFFTPENLSQRCLFIEGAEPNYYYCPDLMGMEAAAFCAGAMLYRILVESHPYPVAASVFQDMREGVFYPPHLAAPGLDEKICGLIQSALLLPAAKKRTSASGTDILGNLLEILMDKDGNITPVPSLFRSLTTEETALLEKEKSRYLKINYFSVKMSRFLIRNKPAVLTIAAVLIFSIFVIGSMAQNRSSRPTTAGLTSDTVVAVYYDSFSALDHVYMEACLMGADKNDVNTVVNLFVVDKLRQTYEYSGESSLIPAKTWRQLGKELPSPDVFGITDLHIERIGGGEDAEQVHYRADYILWVPNEPDVYTRSDILTLRRDRRKNWRITEILRTEY
jgi:hypothetical protein